MGTEAEAFISVYGVTERGNFEGKNILELERSLEDRQAFAEARKKLFEVREQRVHPGRDNKGLTSWNGLMLSAFAEAARALERDDYREVAERNATFLLRELRTEEGRPLRTWKAGEAKLTRYLEDYAYVIEGLIELYQTTFDSRWYQAAHELAEIMITYFQAPDCGFYDTSDDHETSDTRPRELQDNATPSGNAMAAAVLLKLGGLAVEPRYTELARETLAPMQAMMAQYPLGFARWLQAWSSALALPREIAVVGDPEAADTQALLGVLRKGYRPRGGVRLRQPGLPSADHGPGGVTGVVSCLVIWFVVPPRLWLGHATSLGPELGP